MSGSSFECIEIHAVASIAPLDTHRVGHCHYQLKFQPTTFNGTLALPSPSNRIPTCVGTIRYQARGNAINPINADSCRIAGTQLLPGIRENALTGYAFFSDRAFHLHVRSRHGWRLPYGAKYREWRHESI